MTTATTRRLTLVAVLILTLSVNTSGNDPDEPTSYRLSVRVTAYCPCVLCCGASADGLTATGRDAYRPGVAVDPGVIPLGSHLDVPGYEARGTEWEGNGSWVLADDVGSRVRGNSVDVRLRTHAEAVRWGTRTLQVRVWPRSGPSLVAYRSR